MSPDGQLIETPAPGGAGPRPCETCGAAMDERQRYCLECGSRSRHGHDPAARYLAGAGQGHRRARSAVLGAPSARRTFPASLLAAIVSIPLALGGGVLLGRSSADGSDEALLAALRSQRSPVIQVSGSGTSTAATAASATAAQHAGGSARTVRAASANTKVLAHTALGSAHQVVGTKPTPAQLNQGAQIAQSDAHSVGLQASGNGLPDVVAVP